VCDEAGFGCAVKVTRTLAVLLVGASLAGGSAHAGPADDCNQVRNPERQLRGCTAYIKLGKGDPQNLATAYLNRANVYAQRAKYERAFADFDAAMALDDKNPLIPYNRGNAYFDIGQYKLAVADFTRAIELDDRFALAYFNRGLAKEQLGDTVAAAEDYRRALAIDPTAVNAQKRLQALQSQ
jgi:tetratricopeptide (TPR) repeat protein